MYLLDIETKGVVGRGRVSGSQTAILGCLQSRLGESWAVVGAVAGCTRLRRGGTGGIGGTCSTRNNSTTKLHDMELVNILHTPSQEYIPCHCMTFLATLALELEVIRRC